MKHKMEKDERGVQCSAPPSTHPLGKLVADEIKDTKEGEIRNKKYVFTQRGMFSKMDFVPILSIHRGMVWFFADLEAKKMVLCLYGYKVIMYNGDNV